MKSSYRPKGLRLWRAGHEGLEKLQKLLDSAISGSEGYDKVELAGLVNAKVKLNQEVREQLRMEAWWRRESIALDDLELPLQTDVAVLRMLRSRLDAQIKQLSPETDDQSDEDKPNETNDNPGTDDQVTPEGPEQTAMEPPGQTEEIPPITSGENGEEANDEGPDLGPENDD